MTNENKARSAGPIGLFYDPKEYVGFSRRLLIDTIDVMVVGITTLATVIMLGMGESEAARQSVFLACSFGYFVLLKCFTRTVGYRLCGARLVSLTGEAPTLGWLCFRFLFWFVGPLNPLIDLAVIPGDEAKQSLRDKMTHMYVVNTGARAAGTGRLVSVLMFGMAQSWVFLEVEQPHVPLPAH